MRHCISSMLLLRLARGLRGPARPVARLVPTRAAATGDWLGHRSDPSVPASGPGDDWIARIAADDHPGGFAAAKSFVPKGASLTHPPRILVLHGSLRETSFSRKLANEMARLLEVLGCEVRSFDPSDLPVRDPTIEDHPKVVELRALSEWSEGHVWVSPEMHGCITGAFKNQIDWLPLNTGSVRPTQGRTCVVLQVNGGSQSFNAVWKSTSELGYPEKYCVDLREPPRHRADVATGTMSRRWRGIATPSRRRSYGKDVASMAWGARNLISTQVQRRQRAAEARAVDAHALLHEPIFRSESVEGVRRRRQNEAVGF